MATFKLNKKVRIKQWDKMVKEYGIKRDGNINFNDIVFTPNMKFLCGKTAIIIGLIQRDDLEVLLKFDDEDIDTNWIYCVQMLERIK